MRQRRPPPAWPDERARPRIVIENIDPAQQWVEERILRDAGYDVVVCGGPQQPRGQACPLLADADCPAIVNADAVVSSLRVETPAGRDVIASTRGRYPGVPLIVEAPPAAVVAHADVLGGCEVVFPLTAASLVEAVERALARPRAPFG